MTHSEELANALNDLVLINNDRVEGYEKAIETLDNKDVDLKALFTKMISNSKDNLSQLGKMVYRSGQKIEEGTTNSGKIFRVWMSVKSAFSTDDRTSTLESCVTGEDAALKAYDMTLVSDAEMSADVRKMLMDQKSTIQADQNQIKKLRDLHEKLD